MITIILSPQVPNEAVVPVVISKNGDALRINSETLDLSFMSAGDSLPPGSIEHPLLSSALIEKDENGIVIDGLLFHIASDQKDPAACFPVPVVIFQDGPVHLPCQLPPPAKESDDEYQD